MTENCKLRRAILSAFYNISQWNFGILLILWCSFKLWWNFCLDQNFSYKGPCIARSGNLPLFFETELKVLEQIRSHRNRLIGVQYFRESYNIPTLSCFRNCEDLCVQWEFIWWLLTIPSSLTYSHFLTAETTYRLRYDISPVLNWTISQLTPVAKPAQMTWSC
jgi:hypothetical protein